MSVSFWITLAATVGSLVYACLENAEIWDEFKTAAGKERVKKGFKWLLLWAVPAVTLVATLWQAWESVEADKRSSEQAMEIRRQSNRLAHVEVSAPQNQPVRSVAAFARFTFSSTNKNFAIRRLMGEHMESIQLLCFRGTDTRSGSIALSFSAETFETTKVGSAEAHQSGTAGNVASVSFKWYTPVAGIVTGGPGKQYQSAGELIDELGMVYLMPSFLSPPDFDVGDGYVTVTLNSTLQKRFQIAPQQIRDVPIVVGLAETNSAWRTNVIQPNARLDSSTTSPPRNPVRSTN